MCREWYRVPVVIFAVNDETPYTGVYGQLRLETVYLTVYLVDREINKKEDGV